MERNGEPQNAQPQRTQRCSASAPSPASPPFSSSSCPSFCFSGPFCSSPVTLLSPLLWFGLQFQPLFLLSCLLPHHCYCRLVVFSTMFCLSRPPSALPPCPPVCWSGFSLSVFHQRHTICCYTHSQAGPTCTASSSSVKLSLQRTSQSNSSRSSAEEGQRYVPMASAASPAAGDQMRLGNSSRCVPMNPWTPAPLPPCVSCPFSSPEHVCFYTCQQLESGLGRSAAARPTPAARGGRGRWHG